MYAYHFHKKISKDYKLCDKYVTFQKIGEIKYYDSFEREEWVLPIIQVFDKIFDQRPRLEEVKELGVVPFDDVNKFFDDSIEVVSPLVSSFVTVRLDERDYVQKWYEYIGNTKDLVNAKFNENYIQRAMYFMSTWEQDLCTFIHMWDNLDKEKKEELRNLIY